MRRRYRVLIETEVEIEVDDAVFVAVTEEWRSTFYDLRTADDVVKHLAYNVVANNANLSELDGWADQPNSNLLVLSRGDFDMEVDVLP